MALSTHIGCVMARVKTDNINNKIQKTCQKLMLFDLDGTRTTANNFAVVPSKQNISSKTKINTTKPNKTEPLCPVASYDIRPVKRSALL